MRCSDGSSCPLSCQPATVPSALSTHAVICKPQSLTRSVPKMTVMRAVLAASATAVHARSRNAGSGDGHEPPPVAAAEEPAMATFGPATDSQERSTPENNLQARLDGRPRRLPTLPDG